MEVGRRGREGRKRGTYTWSGFRVDKTTSVSGRVYTDSLLGVEGAKTIRY